MLQKCTPSWREAHFQVKMYKTHHSRTIFGRCDVAKVHAVVARSTFPSQNVQNTPAPDHFWTLRCRKSARRCGAKHISKSKCAKHTMFGPLLEAEMSSFEKVHAVVARSTFPSQNVQNTPCSDHFWRLRCFKSARRCGAKHISKSKCTKHTILGPLLDVVMLQKCTPSWREAHFQVKMYKTHHSRTIFGRCDVAKVHAVVARSTFPSQNVQNTPAPDHFWTLRCRKSARRCGAKHISKSKCAKHTMFGPLLEAEMSSFEKVHAVVARSTFPSQNVQNTPCSDHFWRLRCRVSKKCTPLWREAQFQVKMLKTLGFPTTFGSSSVRPAPAQQIDRWIERWIDR